MKSQGIKNNSMFTNPLQKEENHFGTYLLITNKASLYIILLKM